MPRTKCQYCKTELDRKTAYKITVNGKNQYWCNEDCYNHTKAEKEKSKIKVKCQICGKNIDRDTAYRVVVIGPKSKKEIIKYFCSEQEWQAEKARKKKLRDDKNKVYDLVCDMFGYKIINTNFFAEWAIWNQLKSDETIYMYLKENEDLLKNVCNKSYENEYHKIKYFSAIVKNNLKDFVPKIKVEKPNIAIDETIYDVPARSLNKRRSLADLEDEI